VKNSSIKSAVIIPAYNEGSVIGNVLDDLEKNLKRSGLNATIVVVNDGSRDDTAENVGKRKNVVLISHILNSGAGAASRTGLHYARDNGFDNAVTMDADGQHASADVINVLRELSKKESGLVIGSRLTDNEGMIWYRKLGNYGLSLFTFLLFGSTVRDSQSGLRGYSRKALETIEWHSNNFTFNSELMWRARQQRLAIKEIPIKAIYTDYSLAKGQSNWNAIPIFRQLIKRRFLDFFNG
jgi:UDP-N-acetylglucosamine---dolichyl-phosphate N-acetylglucosaminyltransferase